MNDFFEAIYHITSGFCDFIISPINNFFDNFSDDAYRGMALFIVYSLFLLLAIGYIAWCIVRSKYEK